MEWPFSFYWSVGYIFIDCLFTDTHTDPTQVLYILHLCVCVCVCVCVYGERKYIKEGKNTNKKIKDKTCASSSSSSSFRLHITASADKTDQHLCSPCSRCGLNQTAVLFAVKFATQGIPLCFGQRYTITEELVPVTWITWIRLASVETRSKRNNDHADCDKLLGYFVPLLAWWFSHN